MGGPWMKGYKDAQLIKLRNQLQALTSSDDATRQEAAKELGESWKSPYFKDEVPNIVQSLITAMRSEPNAETFRAIKKAFDGFIRIAPPMGDPPIEVHDEGLREGRQLDQYLTEENIRARLLYYPGAGTDHSPFLLFAEHAKVSMVIYADYMLGMEGPDGFLERIRVYGWEASVPVPLNPDFFEAETWDAFWPDVQGARNHRNQNTDFAIGATLTKRDRSPVQFIYLGTDAIQTFSVLVRAGFVPSAIVLQDHGIANWASFGGDSVLYRRALTELPYRLSLPQLLLVAENTQSWPEFQQVSQFCVYEGGGGGHSSRALFSRIR